MNLKEIGEFGFIERFKPMFDNLLHPNLVGIGDDCAIIPFNNKEDYLVTTDLLIEEVHFLRSAISPLQLGYKSLAVNLSDIAAMGGTPVGTFLSIAIPPDIEVEYLDTFMKGYHTLSSKYNVPLMGGDTTRSVKHLAINVCIIGKCSKGKARKRNMAKPGDLVCVTGFLGDSAGGLQILLNKLGETDENNYLLQQHNKPKPRIEEGVFLTSYPEVNAMMDISDGIASDLKHILKASQVLAHLHLDSLPISKQLTDCSAKYGWNTLELASAGGEDYELLVTIEPDKFDSIQHEFQEKFKIALTRIGAVEEGVPEIIWFKDGKHIQFSKSGFNHFNKL